MVSFHFNYQDKGNVLQLQQETQQPANHSSKMAICLEQVRVILGRNSDVWSVRNYSFSLNKILSLVVLHKKLSIEEEPIAWQGKFSQGNGYKRGENLSLFFPKGQNPKKPNFIQCTLHSWNSALETPKLGCSLELATNCVCYQCWDRGQTF